MKNFTGPNPELALRVFACYPGPDGGAPLLDVDFPLLFDFDFFATSDIFLEKIPLCPYVAYTAYWYAHPGIFKSWWSTVSNNSM